MQSLLRLQDSRGGALIAVRGSRLVTSLTGPLPHPERARNVALRSIASLGWSAEFDRYWCGADLGSHPHSRSWVHVRP